MAERVFDVKCYPAVLGAKYRFYEVFNDGGKEVRVEFDRQTHIAKGIPEHIAAKLHRSAAFDIVDASGKVPAEFKGNASPHGVVMISEPKNPQPTPQDAPLPKTPYPQASPALTPVQPLPAPAVEPAKSTGKTKSKA